VDDHAGLPLMTGECEKGAAPSSDARAASTSSKPGIAFASRSRLLRAHHATTTGRGKPTPPRAWKSFSTDGMPPQLGLTQALPYPHFRVNERRARLQRHKRPVLLKMRSTESDPLWARHRANSPRRCFVLGEENLLRLDDATAQSVQVSTVFSSLSCRRAHSPRDHVPYAWPRRVRCRGDFCADTAGLTCEPR